jgi:hypothetical protein
LLVGWEFGYRFQADLAAFGYSVGGKILCQETMVLRPEFPKVMRQMSAIGSLGAFYNK